VFANASHLPEGLACVVGAKANPEGSGQVVPFAGSPKITRLFNFFFSGARESLRLFELKKMCGGEMLVAFTNSLKKTNKM
jgi:hypothetical protein